MKRNIYFIIGVAALLLSAFLIGVRFYELSKNVEQEQKATSIDRARLVRNDSASLGPVVAKVLIVEFLDPECESCRMMAPIVSRLLSEYKNGIHYVVRYMPLHPNSVEAATAIEAAGEQGKYWEALDTLFEHQPEWASHETPKPELITKYMNDLGLDMKAFARSIVDSKHKEKIERDKQDGTYLGVTGTPTFFVNGQMLHDLGYEPLKAAIDAAIGN